MSRTNPASITALVWLILTPVFLALTIWAFNSNLGDASYALAFAGIVLFFTALTVSIVYSIRARKFNRIMAGEGLLITWTYTPDEWKLYTEKENEANKAGKKILFFITAGFAIFVAVVALVIDWETGLGVAAVMAVVIVLMGIVALLTSRYEYHQNRNTVGKVYISKDGIYLNKQLHLWNTMGARLGSVEYVEGNPPLLVFCHFAPTRTGLQEKQLRVPVPLGQEAKAREVLAYFQ
ncbi:MAG: hypothetical protein V1932_04260 [Chloroflexota bacterium]